LFDVSFDPENHTSFCLSSSSITVPACRLLPPRDCVSDHVFLGEERADRHEQGPDERQQKRTERQPDNGIAQGGYEPRDRIRFAAA
jgi:hypothetical protein